MFWADAYAGKEKLVELMHASIWEYYGGWPAHPSKGGKPRIGYVNEYYANQFWRDLWGDEYYSDGE